MNFKRSMALFTALVLSGGLVSCGEKDSESSKIESPELGSEPIAASTIASTAEPTEPTTSKPESGIIYHTDRPNKGIYLEDYVTVKFTGYEHDSAVEMTVDWDAVADYLGNGVTTDILKAIYHVDIRNTEDKFHRFKLDDLVNGDMVVLYMDESAEYDTYELRYPDKIEYIDDNVWGYEQTPVIVSGLKTKEFLDNTTDIDKAVIQKLTDTKMNEIKDSAKDYASNLEGGDILSTYGWKYDVMGNTHYIKINDFKVEKTYLAKRTASSYNDTSASTLPENMVYNIYKLTVERYGTGEVLDLYYRAEVSNILYEDDKMLVSDEAVKVQFAAKAEELVPDSKYWEIEEVK
ncbi:MAG: hypothetical protein PUB97_10165 [Ruminococcus sp.]|nr:hypothetical protein [Ruminococcus sp.]